MIEGIYPIHFEVQSYAFAPLFIFFKQTAGLYIFKLIRIVYN